MKILQVNLEHIAFNLSQVRSLVSSKTAICATLKSDAYGHGIIPVAQCLEKHKIDFFGVATLEEARTIRKVKLKTPILLYAPPYGALEEIFSLSLIPFVSDLNYLDRLEQTAWQQQKKVSVHLKVDVGMGRYGSLPYELFPLVKRIHQSSYLEFHGLCSHFSESEEINSPTTKDQLTHFEKIRQELENQKKLPPFIHIANSEGLLNFPQSHYNLVRLGAILYGYSLNHPHFKEAMSLKSCITSIKTVPAQTPVSYNSLYRTTQSVQLATIPLGYSDGLDIYLAQKGAQVYLNGHYYPLVGKVCMNTCVIEVPLGHSIKVGDIVELAGENQSMKRWSTFYPSASYYDAICRLGCYQQKSYK